MLRRLQEGAPVHDFEARLLARDGATRQVLVHANPAMQEGRLAHALCFVTDVTRSRIAEQRLATQYEVTRALAESETLAEAGRRILAAVCQHLGWEVGGLWSVDTAAGVMRCTQFWHRPGIRAPSFEAMTRAIVFAPGIGLPGRVWTSRAACWIPDVTRDDNFPRASMAGAESLRGAF